jgi:RsmE family RNA methyltransferase
VNLLLIHAHELEPGSGASGASATLCGRRARHVREVLRAQPGRTLRAGIVGGEIGNEGGSAAGAEPFVRLELRLDTPPPPALALRLVLALPRPKVLARGLADVAAAGVKAIDVIGAWRVDKSYWQSPVLAEGRVREVLITGLEQGGDTVLPVVRLHRLFKPFAEDELPALVSAGGAVLADPRASSPCPYSVAGAVTLIVGSERGFTDYEIDKLTAAGARPVTLGPRALRVEAAVAALIGRLA